MPKKINEEMDATTDATKIVDLVDSSMSKEDLVIEPVNDEVVITPAVPVKEVVINNSATKNVRIKTFEKVDCIIGKFPYKIEKDKEASVPSDVAAILVASKKAYRL